jgi:hypothetical protein
LLNRAPNEFSTLDSRLKTHKADARALTSVCCWADRKPMKRRTPGKQLPKPDVKLSDAQNIDVLYGLEPVIDPSLSSDDGGALGGVQFHLVQCPYCGESFEAQVDSSSGSASYVEDCQICCQPIEFSLEIDPAGALQALSTQRSD